MCALMLSKIGSALTYSAKSSLSSKISTVILGLRAEDLLTSSQT